MVSGSIVCVAACRSSGVGGGVLGSRLFGWMGREGFCRCCWGKVEAMEVSVG